MNSKLAKRLRRHVKMMAMDVREINYQCTDTGTRVLSKCGRSMYRSLKRSIKQNILGAK